MRHARRLSQAFFLLLFLFLFIETAAKGADTLGYPVKLFLDFDPLLFLATLLSTHTLVKAFWLSLIVLAATAVLGRMFCGWICPLGTLNHMVGLLRKRTSRPRTPDWYRVKYVLLIFLLVSSLFTMQLAGLFDPLSLLIRSLSLGVYPAVNHGFYATFDALYQIDSSSIASIVDGGYKFLHRTVLAFEQPYFYQGAFITLLFLGILALNLVEPRCASGVGVALRPSQAVRAGRLHRLPPVRALLPRGGTALRSRGLASHRVPLLLELRGDLPREGRPVPLILEKISERGGSRAPTGSGRRCRRGGGAHDFPARPGLQAQDPEPKADPSARCSQGTGFSGRLREMRGMHEGLHH
ncbi:MAG: 4Fe-4S binding protein [Acidobacteriota bacterium]